MNHAKSHMDREYCMKVMKKHPKLVNDVVGVVDPSQFPPVSMTPGEYQAALDEEWSKLAAKLRDALKE